MGNRASSSSKYHDALAYSAAIERQIEEVPMMFRKECKVLLLGKSLSFAHGLRSEYGSGRSAASLTCIGVHSFSDPFSAVTRDVNSSSVRHLVVRYDRADLG